MRRADENGWFSYRGVACKVGRAFGRQPIGLRATATDGVMEVLFLTQVIKELDLRQPQTSPAP